MNDVSIYSRFESLSPFEIKDELIRLAKTEGLAASKVFLNAGRGNPNWIATKARAAFFLLGQFGLSEAKHVRHNAEAGLAGMPAHNGSYGRFKAWIAGQRQKGADAEAVDTLESAVDYAIATFKFVPDDYMHELTDSIIGDNYPVPDRMLKHSEIVVHEYLMWALGAGKRPDQNFDLYAVEGGTAAMCYIFKALKNQRLLNKGDTIAIVTPIFTPYLEMPMLEDYDLKQVHITTTQEESFQLTDAHLKTLEDKTIKALFLVNPANPSGVALNPKSLEKLTSFVNSKRPDLIILTDDVYGTFVPDFASIAAYLPRNTIAVYSFSKYFGCTGWRLGVIGVAKDNVFDKKIAAHPADIKTLLHKRYETLSLTPDAIKFIDRIVADSRDVALNHTSGLSLPQQIMMMMFSLVEMQDTAKVYQAACRQICHTRFDTMAKSLGIDTHPDEQYDRYYGIIDFEFWLRKYVGEDIVTWIKKNIHPLDIAFKLAENHGIVLLNGGGFDAPDWSARVSFANLDDDAYENIGRAVRAVAAGYVQTFKAATGKSLKG